MQSANELYINAVSRLPSSERLRLAALILSELAQEQETTVMPRSALDLLDRLPATRLFKTSAEADAYLREERDAWER